MARGYFLGEREAAELRQLADKLRKQLANTAGRPGRERPDHQAPEVYVARTPAGGIPALDVNTPGTSNVLAADDTPGSAECAIWQRVGTAMQLVGTNQTVRNLNSSAIEGHEWVLVVRDKFGDWYVIPPPGGTTAFSGARVGFTYGLTQTLTSGASRILDWDNEEFDTDGYHTPDVGTGAVSERLTAPEEGYYLVGTRVSFESFTGDGHRTALLRKNGLTEIGRQQQPADEVSSASATISVCTLTHLEAGDYVEVVALQTGPGNCMTNWAAPGDVFWITRQK